jgi:hypothetical protein
MLVVWTKSNPTPWNTIAPNQGTKMLEVNQKFDKRFAFLDSRLYFLFGIDMVFSL